MSPKINRAAWYQSIGFALGLIAILGLAGVAVPIAIRAVAVIAIQVVTGAIIYARIPRLKSPTIAESLGMGFAIGSALSTLSDILLKSTLIRSITWLVPTLVIVLVVTARNLKKDRGVVTRIQETKFESTDLLAIIVISFLYLAHDFVWYISLFASGLCILIAVNPRNRFKTRSLYLGSIIALTALAVVSLVAGIRSRPQFWWINSDDYQLFESLQISLARYGPRDHLGATGISITDYHFLPYAWTGLIDRLSAAPTWVILNRVTPVVVSIALSALVWSFLSRERVHRPKVHFLLACLYPILIVLSFKSASVPYSFIYLLAALFYWTDRRTALIHWSRIPLGVLFTVFVIGTKASNAPTILVGLGVLALIGIATNQPWKWTSLADLLTGAITGALYYFVLLQHATAGSLIDVELFGFVKTRFGDLNELNGHLSLLVVGGIATSAYMSIPLIGMVIFSLHSPSRSSMLGYFSLSIFPLTTLYMLFIGGHPDISRYFVNSGLSIMLLIVLVAVSRSFRTSKLENQDIFPFVIFVIFVIAGFASGSASIYLLENLRSGGRIAMFSRAVASAHWIPLVVIGGFWFIYRASRHKTLPRFAIVLSFILVGNISASATVATFKIYRSAIESDLSAVESIIGTPDEIAGGSWIRSHVPVDAIIASNHFCGREECFGSNWFNEQLDLTSLALGGDTFGGSNFLLPAYSERRFLIQGPRFLWALNKPPAWAIDRMNATLGFVNSPNEQTLTALQKFDVEYFVVDLESTAQRTWLPFGKLLYQNRSFAILQLRRD